ncbi:MAG: transposase [Thiohalomonadales bacterium]
MPGKPRMYLPGAPFHIIQRGNNRDATFFAEQDYQYYLECLYDATRQYHADIHVYVLMINHVYLLMTPAHRGSISLVDAGNYLLLCSRYIEMNPVDVRLIRNAARFSMATGDNRFIIQIEEALKRKVGYAHRRRPGKTRSMG